MNGLSSSSSRLPLAETHALRLDSNEVGSNVYSCRRAHDRADENGGNEQADNVTVGRVPTFRRRWSACRTRTRRRTAG